jgi:hypothetical protein
MKKTLIAVVVCASLLIVSISASAHHSFQAEYDQNQPLSLVGKLTKVVQENPHGWIYLDTKNAQGKTVELGAGDSHPFVVQQNGFNREVYQEMVNSGEVVTVTAYAAKDGSKHAWAGGLTRRMGELSSR